MVQAIRRLNFQLSCSSPTNFDLKPCAFILQLGTSPIRFPDGASQEN
jgi:hypothetical protein